MTSPRVTVLMSVYNGEKYLREAIDSILNQTFKDFEFLIINDCSTARTAEILESYQDPRIRIVCNENNMGLTKSLNKGLKLAQGEYIARMDADDISLPERLQKQVEFLDKHQDIGVLGTWVEVIKENGVLYMTWRLPVTPSLVVWHLLFTNSMAHPSVMMRIGVIEQVGFYDAQMSYAQDYELWSRVSYVTKLANLPEILLKRRISIDTIESRYFQEQEQVAITVMYSMISRLVEQNVPSETVKDLRQFILGRPLTSSQQIESVANLIQLLHQAYLKVNLLSQLECAEVTRDVSIKLNALARSACRISFIKGLLLRIRVLRMSFHLLPTAIALKKIKVFVGRTFQT